MDKNIIILLAPKSNKAQKVYVTWASFDFDRNDLQGLKLLCNGIAVGAQLSSGKKILSSDKNSFYCFAFNLDGTCINPDKIGSCKYFYNDLIRYYLEHRAEGIEIKYRSSFGKVYTIYTQPSVL